MRKIYLVLFIIVLAFGYPLILTGNDSLRVSQGLLIEYEVNQLGKDLELNEEQKESIRQILETENRLKSTTWSESDLPPYFNLLNTTQKEKWLRYSHQDKESSQKSSGLKSTTNIQSEHVIELSTGHIHDATVRYESASTVNTPYDYYEEICAVAWGWDPELCLRTYMFIDLFGIPAGSKIVNATLYLYSDPQNPRLSGQLLDYNNPTNYYPNIGVDGTVISNPASNAMFLERVTGYWDYGVTWRTQPATTPEGRIFVRESFSAIENIQVDMTGMVQEWVNSPYLNWGVKFQLQNEFRFRSRNYASTDHPDSGLHPRLIVFYNSPTGNVEYTYDNAGNRLDRQVVIFRSLKQASRNFEPIEQHSVSEADIKGSLEDSNVTLYPNPTHDQLNMRFDKVLNTPVTYILTDLTGVPKLQGEMTEGTLKTLRLGELPPGVYLLRLQQGSTSVSYKIIKK
ncbi:MAG: DNRLRE domain-containing protein [Bacteroidales bacterium]|nr:DNRLRE domain-containing protein [Bacteroidales bacterium]